MIPTQNNVFVIEIIQNLEYDIGKVIDDNLLELFNGLLNILC